MQYPRGKARQTDVTIWIAGEISRTEDWLGGNQQVDGNWSHP